MTINDKFEKRFPYYATSRLWDDGVIDPLKLEISLEIAYLLQIIRR